MGHLHEGRRARDRGGALSPSALLVSRITARAPGENESSRMPRPLRLSGFLLFGLLAAPAIAQDVWVPEPGITWQYR